LNQGDSQSETPSTPSAIAFQISLVKVNAPNVHAEILVQLGSHPEMAMEFMSQLQSSTQVSLAQLLAF